MTTSIELAALSQPPVSQEAEQLAALLELATHILAAETVASACRLLARQGREFAGSRLTAVGVAAPRARCRLRATSGSGEIDAASGLARLLEDALDECRRLDAIVHWPPRDEDGTEPNIAHRTLAKQFSPAASLISAPLRNGAGHVVGAWLFVFEEPEPILAGFEHWLETACGPLGTALDLLARATAGPLARAVRRASALPRSWWLVPAAVATIGLAVALAQRVSYRVPTECVLQPQTRRFVAAPFHGQLEACLVKPGDMIEAEQPLGRMDGRSLRVELAGVVAEYDRARKEQDVSLAAGKVAQAQIATLDCERLDQKRQLLAQRMQQLELRSPLAGVVLTGDLERSEGAPVTLGQALFEVAPLDRMICEIAVAEEDVAHVQPGQSAEVRLEAFPGRIWSGKVESIHPRSEIRDRKNIFVAEVSLDNDEKLLRPGMKGSASIETAPQPRGWIWFHKPWAKARRLWE